MRERISRGKRIDNGEWIYWDRYGRITDINGEPTKTEIDIPTLLPYPTYIADLPIINDETVGDYTGLTDKKGKRIFEGDIVKSWSSWWRTPERIEVDTYEVVCRHLGALDLVRKTSYGEKSTSLNRSSTVEVIGNKWDNPELLEKCKDFI